MALSPLQRQTLDIGQLTQEHPLRVSNKKKRILFDIIRERCPMPAGQVTVSRWPSRQLPVTFSDETPAERHQEDVYDYATEGSEKQHSWHVNFANAHVFCAYGKAAFAQDEIQVAEHPILGHIAEALHAAGGQSYLTVDDGKPTPILASHLPRQCHIDLNSDLAMPYGIYGYRFQKASRAILEQACQPLDGPGLTHLIAMEAPTPAPGPYTRETIEFALQTAFTGFSAAVTETATWANESATVTIHTGHWGTGVYGGSRILMAAIQLFAARLAGVREVVFHTFDNDGTRAYLTAVPLAERWAQSGEVNSWVSQALAAGFECSSGDGN